MRQTLLEGAYIRKIVAQQLCTKPVDIYRSEEANKLMETEDPEPPHLYKASVLHVAKKQYLQSKYLDKDPFTALCMMCCNPSLHTGD
ncbi:hypothetical protein PUN28_014010 [Cardiocondyla obscurior]|uniref:Uncharacterized protein n=1 Tax=Cardiocondyla obscurior TaxID=286306 RepID=A0AAW2F9Y3_9HYME